jgi:hypothetical protein
MKDVFLRHREAWEFIQSIADPTDRLLVEVALSNAMSALVSDANYQRECSTAPFDLLNFARASRGFLRNKQTLRDILDGKVTSIEDLNPFPKP